MLVDVATSFFIFLFSFFLFSFFFFPFSLQQLVFVDAIVIAEPHFYVSVAFNSDILLMIHPLPETSL